MKAMRLNKKKKQGYLPCTCNMGSIMETMKWYECEFYLKNLEGERNGNSGTIWLTKDYEFSNFTCRLHYEHH